MWHDLIIDGVAWEMSETRMRQLSEEGAIIQEDGEWIINHGFKHFTYQQLRWFLSLQEDD